MILLLFLIQLNNFKAEISPAILFPASQLTQQYFNPIYDISANGVWKVSEEFAPGIYVQLLKKNGNPYQDAYFQDTDMMLKLLAYGAGGCFEYQITNYFSVGAGAGIYRVKFNYPYTTSDAKVINSSNTKTKLGFYSAFSVYKQVKKWRFGASLKIQIIGAQHYNYDYLVYPYYYDTTPAFPSPIQGIALSLNLGYEPRTLQSHP